MTCGCCLERPATHQPEGTRLYKPMGRCGRCRRTCVALRKCAFADPETARKIEMGKALKQAPAHAWGKR